MKMKELKLSFTGPKAETSCRAFFSWLVDGGGEDVVIDALADYGFDVEISECDEMQGQIKFVSRAGESDSVIV